MGIMVNFAMKYFQISAYNSQSQGSYFAKSHVDSELEIAYQGAVCLEKKV